MLEDKTHEVADLKDALEEKADKMDLLLKQVAKFFGNQYQLCDNGFRTALPE